MQRFAAAVACVLAGCLSPTLRAQSPAPPVTRHAFSYCSVTDTASHKVWASPVFEYAYLADGSNRFTRMQDLASEFHAIVGGMGGAGDKTCLLADGEKADIEAFRNESRATLTQRFMGIVRAHKWMDVAWTPQPWNPATAAMRPATVTRYFYCYATDMDDDKRASVATQVFEMSVDNSDPVAAYTQAETYGKQFARDVAAPYGLANGQPSCLFKDTRAEAEKALHDYRKTFSGFTLKFTDVTWLPAQGAAATPAAVTNPAAPAAESGTPPPKGRLGIEVGEVCPTLALALGMDRARGALVITVKKDHPGDAAGIKPVDVVLGLNQQAVNQFTELSVLVSRLPAGTPYTLQVWRERAEHEVQILP